MTHLRNDLLCVKWDVKAYTLTHWAGDHISVSSVITRCGEWFVSYAASRNIRLTIHAHCTKQ